MKNKGHNSSKEETAKKLNSTMRKIYTNTKEV